MVSQTTTIDLHHDVRGTGPLLVLVHGLSESTSSWDPLMDDLAADHRVMRVDLRGHGASPKAGGYRTDEMAADTSGSPPRLRSATVPPTAKCTAAS